MPLLVYNITGVDIVLAAGNPTPTIPLSVSPPNRGPAVNVTGELRPDPIVDPVNGVAGGLDAIAFAALEAQRPASLEYEWTADPEYLTATLTVNGPAAGPHAATHLPGAADALTTGTAGAAAIGDAAAEGVAASFSRSDHKHSVASAAPSAVGDANAEGAATTFSRADHVHAQGGTAGGDLTGSFPNPTVASAVLDPANDAVADADGLGSSSAIRKAFTAGGGGADDVTIYNANAPFKFRILDVTVWISTGDGGGGAVQLRDTAGGAGSVLSRSFSSNATGLVREDGSGTSYATVTVAAGGSLYLRRTDNTCAGEVIIQIYKET